MDETNKNASGSENIDDADLNEWLNDWPIDAADPDHLDSAVDTARSNTLPSARMKRSAAPDLLGPPV